MLRGLCEVGVAWREQELLPDVTVADAVETGRSAHTVQQAWVSETRLEKDARRTLCQTALPRGT